MALYLPCLFLSLVLIFSNQAEAIHKGLKIYMVAVESCSGGDHAIKAHYLSILQKALGSRSKASHSLVYVYEQAFCGFAAMLTAKEEAKLAETDGVVSVYPSRTINLDPHGPQSNINAIEGLGGPSPVPIAP